MKITHDQKKSQTSPHRDKIEDLEPRESESAELKGGPTATERTTAARRGTR